MRYRNGLESIGIVYNRGYGDSSIDEGRVRREMRKRVEFLEKIRENEGIYGFLFLPVEEFKDDGFSGEPTAVISRYGRYEGGAPVIYDESEEEGREESQNFLDDEEIESQNPSNLQIILKRALRLGMRELTDGERLAFYQEMQGQEDTGEDTIRGLFLDCRVIF